MNKEDFKLWDNISTKTTIYHRNFDMVVPNDNIISEYDGIISKLRFREHKQPETIGEFTLSVWNISLGKLINANIDDMIEQYSDEDTYYEFNLFLNDTNFDYLNYNKIVFIHSLIIKPEYRKKGITEEFIEYIYKNFYDKKSIIFALVKPIQDNELNCVFYSKEKFIRFVDYDENGKSSTKKMSAFKYYSLDNELNKTDIEINEYKLFSVASKCGFKRLQDGFLFQYEPENTLKRLNNKQKKLNNFKV